MERFLVRGKPICSSPLGHGWRSKIYAPHPFCYKDASKMGSTQAMLYAMQNTVWDFHSSASLSPLWPISVWCVFTPKDRGLLFSWDHGGTWLLRRSFESVHYLWGYPVMRRQILSEYWSLISLWTICQNVPTLLLHISCVSPIKWNSLCCTKIKSWLCGHHMCMNHMWHF